MRKRELTLSEIKRAHYSEFEGVSLSRQARTLGVGYGKLKLAVSEFRTKSGLRAPEPVVSERKRLTKTANPEFYGEGYGRRPGKPVPGHRIWAGLPESAVKELLKKTY